jgi:hypothetical protein
MDTDNRPAVEPRVKFPRTYHFPWSESMTDDDKMIKSLDSFSGKRVIITEKRDGESTTWGATYNHARSIDSANHPSRNWMKGEWAKRCSDIPFSWRICLENLYAVHSIHYTDLPSYMAGINIWDDTNTCLDWDTTKHWFQLLDIEPVPVWYDGEWNEDLVKSLWKQRKADNIEGYVVRVAGSFSYVDYATHVGKFVRHHHVQPNAAHWRTAPVVPNGLLV